MIYPVYVYGSPVLHKPAEEIDADFPELGKLIDDMFETMYDANGVGLAAPQIGKGIRVFVVDTVPYADDDDVEAEELAGRLKTEFINPEIYETSEEQCVMGEGCLSLPGLSEEVIRPKWIKIRWVDKNFVEHDQTFEGYKARVIQHEYDHLDGVVFTERLSPLRKNLLKGKLTNMSKGKYSAEYKTRQVIK